MAKEPVSAKALRTSLGSQAVTTSVPYEAGHGAALFGRKSRGKA